MSRANRRPTIIAIDDGIKASLATLELVQNTSRNGNKTLSNNEVELVHLSLDQIIRTAESIKEKLPSKIVSEAEGGNSIPENGEKAIPPSSRSASLVQKGEKITNGGRKSELSSVKDDDEPEQKRRLSTPCLVPMDTAMLPVSSSWIRADSQKLFVSCLTIQCNAGGPQTKYCRQSTI